MRADPTGGFIVDFIRREITPENAAGTGQTFGSVARFRATEEIYKQVVMQLTNAYFEITGKPRPPS